MGVLHKLREDFLLVDLVADVVYVGWEVVLGMIMDNVTNVIKDQILEYAVLQIFQEPVESHNKIFRSCCGSMLNHKEVSFPSLYHFHQQAALLHFTS